MVARAAVRQFLGPEIRVSMTPIAKRSAAGVTAAAERDVRLVGGIIGVAEVVGQSECTGHQQRAIFASLDDDGARRLLLGHDVCLSSKRS